jgi:hypothetical protein
LIDSIAEQIEFVVSRKQSEIGCELFAFGARQWSAALGRLSLWGWNVHGNHGLLLRLHGRHLSSRQSILD